MLNYMLSWSYHDVKLILALLLSTPELHRRPSHSVAMPWARLVAVPALFLLEKPSCKNTNPEEFQRQSLHQKHRAHHLHFVRSSVSLELLTTFSAKVYSKDIIRCPDAAICTTSKGMAVAEQSKNPTLTVACTDNSFLCISLLHSMFHPHCASPQIILTTFSRMLEKSHQQSISDDMN